MNGVATLTCSLNLPAVFTREDEWVVASFPHLDVTSQGRTQDEAARNLIEAAQLFIESCFERNILDEVLKNCGFVPGHTLPRPQASDGNLQHLTVPFRGIHRDHRLSLPIAPSWASLPGRRRCGGFDRGKIPTMFDSERTRRRFLPNLLDRRARALGNLSSTAANACVRTPMMRFTALPLRHFAVTATAAPGRSCLRAVTGADYAR